MKPENPERLWAFIKKPGHGGEDVYAYADREEAEDNHIDHGQYGNAGPLTEYVRADLLATATRRAENAEAAFATEREEGHEALRKLGDLVLILQRERDAFEARAKALSVAVEDAIDGFAAAIAADDSADANAFLHEALRGLTKAKAADDAKGGGL